MCISDYRIGRLIRSVVSFVDVATGVNVSFPPRNDRVGITFIVRTSTGTSTQHIVVTIDGISEFTMNSVCPPVTFSLKDHGDLPMHGFTIATGIVLARATVIEQFLPPDILAANLYEYEREYTQWLPRS